MLWLIHQRSTNAKVQCLCETWQLKTSRWCHSHYLAPLDFKSHSSSHTLLTRTPIQRPKNLETSAFSNSSTISLTPTYRFYSTTPCQLQVQTFCSEIHVSMIKMCFTCVVLLPPFHCMSQNLIVSLTPGFSNSSKEGTSNLFASFQLIFQVFRGKEHGLLAQTPIVQPMFLRFL